jgi:hypothetical protein
MLFLVPIVGRNRVSAPAAAPAGRLELELVPVDGAGRQRRKEYLPF